MDASGLIAREVVVMFTRAGARAAMPGIIASLFAALLAAAALAEAAPPGQDAAEERQSTTRHYVKGGRSKPELAATTEDRYGDLVTSGPRTRPAGAGNGNTKPSESTLQSSSNTRHRPLRW